MLENDLSRNDVKELLWPITDGKVIDELYSFGSMLLSEIKERNAQLESKAAVVLGWATGISAFLFTQIKQVDHWSLLALPPIIAAIVAIIFAYRVIKTRDDWESPSDKDWFCAAAIGKDDDLRLFHIRSMHRVRQNQSVIAMDKANALLWAERWLIFATMLLAMAIAAKLIVSLYPLARRFF